MSDTAGRRVQPPSVPPGPPGTAVGARAIPPGSPPPAPAGLTTADDASLGDLMGRITSDLGTLFHQEFALAKVELKEEAAKAGKSAGMLGGAAFSGYMAVLLLSIAAAWGLAEVMAPGFAFLVTGALYAVVAGVLFATGRKKMKSVHGPQQTVQTAKEDAQWARNLKN